MMLCVTKLQQHPQMLKSVLHLLSTAMANGTCGIDLEDFDSLFESHLPRDATNEADPDTLDMSLDNLVSALTRLVAAAKTNEGGFIEQNKAVATTGGVRSVIGLPKQIVSLPCKIVERCLLCCRRSHTHDILLTKSCASLSKLSSRSTSIRVLWMKETGSHRAP